MGVSASTAVNLLLGAGDFLVDFVTATKTGTNIGATEDGGKFVVKRKHYEGNFNGTLGPVKGLVRIIEEIPEIEITMSELTFANLQIAMPGLTKTVNAQGSSLASAHNGQYQSSEWRNIALKVPKSTAGKYMYFCVDNALCEDPPEFSTDDQKNTKVKVKLKGYYDPSTPMTPPWRIIDETVVS